MQWFESQNIMLHILYGQKENCGLDLAEYGARSYLTACYWDLTNSGWDLAQFEWDL